MSSQFLPPKGSRSSWRQLVLGAVVTFGATPPSDAQDSPFTMTYGGRLTQPDGKAISGPVSLVIKFFPTAAGGSPIGQPITRNNVNLENGVFQVDLADLSTMGSLLSGSTTLFIEITDATNSFTYPRQRITAVPYALRVPVDGSTITYDGSGRLRANITAGAISGAAISPSTVATGTVRTDSQEAIVVRPYGNTSGQTGELRFNALSAGGANYVGFKAPDAVSGSTIFTLPPTDGSNGQVLSTNGMGQLSWIPNAAFGGSPVTAVNGRTGSVSLTSDDISEGATRLYFTTDRARQASSATAPLAYNTATGAISITQASTVASGFLSSADFTSFNNKQAAITAASVINAGTVTTALQNGVELKPFGASVGKTGELRFDELAVNGPNYVGFKAADVISNNVIWSLPSSDGTTGQVLTTDGAGKLYWTTNIGGGASPVTSVAGRTGAVTLETSDILGLGSLATLNAVGSPQITDGSLTNADIASSAAIADSKLATISSASKVANSATTATSANMPSAIVARDATGNFSAGTITASLNGNATNVTGIVDIANGGTGAASALAARSNLELGSAATLNVGTAASNIVQLDGTAKLPAVDGTQLTGVVKSAGDTMTGTLILPSNGLVAGTSQLVLSGGNVGIGITSPGQKLSVAGFVQSMSGGFQFPDGTIQTTAAGGGVGPWITSGSNVYRTGGNVGIGTSFPSATLDVYGTTRLNSSVTASSLNVTGTTQIGSNGSQIAAMGYCVQTSGSVGTSFINISCDTGTAPNSTNAIVICTAPAASSALICKSLSNLIQCKSTSSMSGILIQCLWMQP